MYYQPAFAVVVRGLMRAQQMNATQLGERSGYSRSYVAKLINGQSTPTLDAASDILTALGTTLPHILYQIELHEIKVRNGEAQPASLPDPEQKQPTPPQALVGDQQKQPTSEETSVAVATKSAHIRLRSSRSQMRKSLPRSSFLDDEEVPSDTATASSGKYTTQRRRRNVSANAQGAQGRKRDTAPPASESVDPGVAAMDIPALLGSISLAYMPSKAKGLPLDYNEW